MFFCITFLFAEGTSVCVVAFTLSTSILVEVIAEAGRAGMSVIC